MMLLLSEKELQATGKLSKTTGNSPSSTPRFLKVLVRTVLTSLELHSNLGISVQNIDSQLNKKLLLV